MRQVALLWGPRTLKAALDQGLSVVQMAPENLQTVRMEDVKAEVLWPRVLARIPLTFSPSMSLILPLVSLVFYLFRMHHSSRPPYKNGLCLSARRCCPETARCWYLPYGRPLHFGPFRMPPTLCSLSVSLVNQLPPRKHCHLALTLTFSCRFFVI